jgi:predicted permease
VIDVWTNLRHSARSFARTPSLTLALLGTIALGIGSNAAVLGFVRGSLARSLPIPGIDTVVSLFAWDSQDGFGPVSYEGYLALLEHREPFELLGAARESQASIVSGDRHSVMAVAAVTPELARLLQLSLDGGVAISHRVWQAEFGARPDIVSTPIRIDGVDTRVAQVVPDWLEGLYFGRAIDVWMAVPERSLRGVARERRTFWLLGRLRPGVSADAAQALLNATRSAADAIAVRPYTGMTADASSGMARIGGLLRVAAGMVFFIACANVASFLLARASARSHETSVRVALGAGRGQLARGLLADSILISVSGGVFGMLLALWTTDIVPAFFFEQDAERLVFAPDPVSTVAVSAVCVGITMACGLMPLFDLRHDNPAAVLQRESTGPSKRMRRLRASLVVAQMACCCVLVVSTAVLADGFRAALQTPLGQRLGQPVLATAEAGRLFTRPDLGLEYFQQLEQAALTVPGIFTTAWVGMLPGSRPAWTPLRVEPPQLALRDLTMDVVPFTPSALADVAMPPLAGRMFGGGDTAHTCKVVVVNEEAAAEVSDGNAVGRVIEAPSGQRVEIIGIVASRRQQTEVRSRPIVYYYPAQIGTPPEEPGRTRVRVPIKSPPVEAMLDANVVSRSYFDAIGLAPVAGSIFPDEPVTERCRAGVINQEAAELYFGGHAVGGAVIDGLGRRTEIVGVVPSALLRTSQRRVEPTIYFPLAQDFRPRMTLILGARGTTDEMLGSIAQRLDAVPGGRGPLNVTTLATHMARTALAPERIATVLVAASATTSLTLGVLGLYGAMSDAARQRRREVALRIALGARGRRVIQQVLADGLRLAGAGMVAGMLGSLLVARWLARIAPHAGVPTAWVWLAAPLVLLAAVGVASVLPARRALRVDPLTIMRDRG